MFELLIAKHCSPALAGIKPGNLISVGREQFPNLYNEIQRLNSQLNRKNIYLETLCECKKRVLIFVYRKKQLSEYLLKNDIHTLLKSYGYGECKSLEDYIAKLKSRLTTAEFPHEIGAFLGYPSHDIYGFINHKDSGCLLVGEWRVYKDAECAEYLFNRYRRCRNAVLRRIDQGKTLAQIFCAS